MSCGLVLRLVLHALCAALQGIVSPAAAAFRSAQPPSAQVMPMVLIYIIIVRVGYAASTSCRREPQLPVHVQIRVPRAAAPDSTIHLAGTVMPT